MPQHNCPACNHRASWMIRRNARKCKRCRKERTPRHWLVHGMHVSQQDWRIFLKCFLLYKTICGIRMHFPRAHTLLIKMSYAVRSVMSHDLPIMFSGTTEVDETYISGTWYNKRWSVRKRGTKRGRGTTKQPIFGIFERDRKMVLSMAFV